MVKLEGIINTRESCFILVITYKGQYHLFKGTVYTETKKTKVYQNRNTTKSSVNSNIHS